MEGRHQGRPGPCSYIPAAKVGDHADTGKLGEQRRVADLHGEAASRLMADGLAMAADRADGLGLQPLLVEQLPYAFTCQAGPAVLCQRGARNLVGATAAEAEQLLAQVGRHGKVMSGEQLKLLALIDQGDIQAIKAGAGHHPR